MRRVRGTLRVLAEARGQGAVPFLPRHRLEALRDARIRRIVAHAAASVPHYRDLFAREGIDPREVRGARELDALPLLDPDEVRRDPARFLSGSRRAREALPFVTGGTTGRPLEIRHDRRSVLANIAFGERERAPLIALCGGSFRPRELHVGYETSNFRQVTAFTARHTYLPRPRRTTVSMSAPFAEVVAAVNEVRPDVLTAYGGFLDAFYRAVVARGVALHRPRVIVFVGEALPEDRREWLEHETGARVLSRYCATEAFKIGYFCEQRRGFHVHEDLCHVRLLGDAGRETTGSEPGRVVVSNLVNHATVLLNYPMGDLATWAVEPCPCGRSQRMLAEVQGRVEDVIRRPGGDALHPRAVWAVFKDDRSVLQYQLIQHDLGRFDLRLATADAAAFPPARDRALAALRALLGPDARIDVSLHAELGREERARTGKFRCVVSRIPAAGAAVPRCGEPASG